MIWVYNVWIVYTIGSICSIRYVIYYSSECLNLVMEVSHTQIV